MPRPRGFQQNTTLSRAMRVFWRQGYEGTSVRDLEAATGLNASSLYNAWGGKEAMFRQVLDYYVERIVQRRIDAWLASGDPIEGIRGFFETTFDYIDSDHDPLACLLTNTAQELARHRPALQQQVAQGMERVEAGFRKALERAPDRLPPGHEAEDLARSLAMGLQGILVSSRVTPDRQRLQALTDAILAPLERARYETATTE